MLINIMTVYMLCYVGKNKCIIIIIIIIIITTSEVRSIILKSTNASCDLDPFPTRLLKHYIDDDLIVPITAIINLSMREGVVPPAFKQALVNPLIKKKTLYRNEFKNYRPISNLSFLSQILEKIVAKRLNAHIEEHLLSNHV